MATNNNEARKKQEKMEAFDNSGDSSLPTSVVVVPQALSIENIVKEFPDFLLCCVLPYIADRVV